MVAWHAQIHTFIRLVIHTNIRRIHMRNSEAAQNNNNNNNNTEEEKKDHERLSHVDKYISIRNTFKKQKIKTKTEEKRTGN